MEHGTLESLHPWQQFGELEQQNKIIISFRIIISRIIWNGRQWQGKHQHGMSKSTMKFVWERGNDGNYSILSLIACYVNTRKVKITGS